MIDTALQILAPHPCYGCGSLQALLCDNCKYDITSNRFEGCIGCGTATRDGVCGSCRSSYSRAWCVGERSGELQALVNGFKFERKKASARICADLLHEVIAELPKATIVIPVPTITKHVRQRGYDHTALVAKRFATLRALPYSQVLRRATSSVQLGASRKQRLAQAEEAFRTVRDLQGKTVLLVDDVTTTGATLHFAAAQLRQAGATDVWVAVIARQPLEKSA